MKDPSPITLTSERVQLLRTVHQNHSQLSAVADQKASILIAASLIVLTLIFGQLDPENFSLTLIVLAAFLLASTAFAVFATLPRAKPESGRAHKFNLFFFGSFAQLSEREFTTSLMDALGDDRRSLETMIHDIYQLGAFLYLRKYRFLRWSYTTLLIGLGVTALTWLIELVVS